MRPVREITVQEKNIRIAPIPIGQGSVALKSDPIQVEAVGTIVLLAFRVTGYDQDCDHSLVPRLEHVDKEGEATGWEVNMVDISSDTALVVTQEELTSLFK